MSAKQTIGVRLPDTWVEKLKGLADETGVPVSALLTEAVGRYLEEDVSGVCDRLTRVEREVSDIKRRMLNLAQV